MKGNDLYVKARALLGAETVGITRGDEKALKNDALRILTLVLDDLGIEHEISSLNDEIECSKSQAQAIIYGMAMYLCVSLGLSERQSFFAGLFDSHRTHTKGNIERVKDVLPLGGVCNEI